MNIAIGIDAVCVDRFTNWHLFLDEHLARIFSLEEITYARANKKLFAQRLAVRFAAKEAFLKALQQLMPNVQFHLLKVAKAVCVIKEKTGAPQLSIRWSNLGLLIKPNSIT